MPRASLRSVLLRRRERNSHVASLDDAVWPRTHNSLHQAPESVRPRLSPCTGFSKPDLKSPPSLEPTNEIYKSRRQFAPGVESLERYRCPYCVWCECARKRLEEHGGCVSSEWTPVPGRPGTVAKGQHHFPPIGAISQLVPVPAWRARPLTRSTPLI